ncbi:hypothetical protein EIN_405750 [Entamoeba invadens IP1]|uniref:Uncharacterized protein n=1 Tax=Entamoeba invadens IP1 TaxID=370355 RepID=A0A0A1UAD6_ENTIV|nr:hypothetical protein EIN_405750 [Entamoeba invadens IP1]ELP90141.1 hypothetical protein EIN_405750 [Entamoeba invadens IP1]|eukprot:XP_004256912.1 hypothetical protein EIN_405750 [Entamoeba invadens IP1]
MLILKLVHKDIIYHIVFVILKEVKIRFIINMVKIAHMISYVIYHIMLFLCFNFYIISIFSKDKFIHITISMGLILKNNMGTILEADKYEIKPCTEDQFELFNENIDKIENCRIDEFHFDMKAYCVFYCNQDVRILKQDNLKEYGGKVREFIQGAIYGERCMTRDNKKWHVTEELYDNDACSLYLSAINR